MVKILDPDVGENGRTMQLVGRFTARSSNKTLARPPGGLHDLQATGTCRFLFFCYC